MGWHIETTCSVHKVQSYSLLEVIMQNAGKDSHRNPAQEKTSGNTGRLHFLENAIFNKNPAQIKWHVGGQLGWIG